jgi:uncharacterized protein YbjQ (UPF0145 family)
MKTENLLQTALALLILTPGCATNTHQADASRGGVKIYSALPEGSKVVGTVHATSFYGITLEQAHQDALRTLQAEASQLGANGIVFSHFDDQPMQGVKAEAKAVYISP